MVLFLGANVAQDAQERCEGKSALSVRGRQEESSGRDCVQACCNESYFPLTLLFSWYDAADKRVKGDHCSKVGDMGGQYAAKSVSDDE